MSYLHRGKWSEVLADSYFKGSFQKNKLAKLIVLPSALKDTEGCRRHRRTMKAMKGIKGNEGIEYDEALSFPF